MRTYLNKAMGALATELSAGLLRLRRGYVDAAEALYRIIDPNAEYPRDFVVYRLTGYRPRGDEPSVTFSGRSLRADLLRLMLDVSGSFSLAAADYPGRVFHTDSLARRFRVSTRTVQRWRRGGLPARKLVFADGGRRLGFTEDSLRWYVAHRRRQVLRSVRFTLLTEAERRDIIRRARRMARFTRCCLADIAKRLSARTGRAVETIRYTIRRHDFDRPDEAIFPFLSAPLDEETRSVVYQCFLHGVSAPALAQRYHRTRGSIYRIINEMRAKQLLSRPIGFIYNPSFELPDAARTILAEDADSRPNEGAADPAPPAARPDETADAAKIPSGLPPYLMSLYGVPLLTAPRERDLFRRYNYLKFRCDALRKQINLNRVRTSHLKEIERLLVRANAAKNEIVRANLRLVVSIAKKHLGGPQGLFELISDGNVSLIRAVEKFDYGRGTRFSTYASWAIIRGFARSVPKEKYQLDRFATGNEEVLDIASALRTYDPNEVNIPELRESIDALLAQLSPRERAILVDHYGLGESHPSSTLDQVGRHLGLSKERVRQIEVKALTKLRRIVSPAQTGLGD